MIDVEGSIAELRAIWSSGPSMHKRPDDLTRYEVLFDRIRPAVLVETGLYYGGSHLWFADRVPQVLTVEHNEQSVADFEANIHGLGEPPANGFVFTGDSLTLAAIVTLEARRLADGGPILVVLDSDHGTEQVYREMVAYSPLVTPGSYLVVEDGILHYLETGPFKEGNWFDGDPLLAIQQFLTEHPDDWYVDVELEDLTPLTQHPSGWLRRC